jgi:hypothetical protein
MGRQPVVLDRKQFGRKSTSLKGFMAAVAMVVLSKISGSSRTLSCCYNSNTSKDKSAKKLYSKKSRETCTDLSLGSWQESGFGHVHLQELVPGLHHLLHLTPQDGLDEGDPHLAELGLEHVHLQGGHSALLFRRALSFASSEKSSLESWGRMLCCFWEECLVAFGEECLSAKGEECLAAFGKNALLLRKEILSLAPRRTYSAWLPKGLSQIGSLGDFSAGLPEDYSVWLPRRGLSAWLSRRG